MEQQDNEFSLNGKPAPDVGVRPLVGPQHLAQLVMATRAAVQAAAMPQSAAQEQSQAPPRSVLGPTDPFNATAYGFGSAAPQSSVSVDRVRDKVAAIQRGRQAQAQQVSDADRAAGNFIRVGQRPLLPDFPADLWYHTYLEIPRVENGKFTGEYDTYGVLGEWNEKKNEGTDRNQEVRKNDPNNRNEPKESSNRNKIYEVQVTAAQREALMESAEYWSDKQQPHQCPSCGSNYVRGGPLSGPAYNSNTWVYNMLIHNPAGRIEPPAAINKHDAPGWAVNDVGSNYYPQ